MKFAIKGDSDNKAQELYKFAGRNVKLTVQPSQMSIDEFYEDYDEPKDEEVVSPGQITIEEIDNEEDSLCDDFLE